MASAEPIDVEVAYAAPDRQSVIAVRVAAGTPVVDAIRQSGILQMFPEIALSAAKVGIYSRRVRLDEVVNPGDRIEIYRPLLADPKTIRRQRAGAATKKG